jgi:hypothetical protein
MLKLFSAQSDSILAVRVCSYALRAEGLYSSSKIGVVAIRLAVAAQKRLTPVLSALLALIFVRNGRNSC